MGRTSTIYPQIRGTRQGRKANCTSETLGFVWKILKDTAHELLCDKHIFISGDANNLIEENYYANYLIRLRRVSIKIENSIRLLYVF